MYPSLLLIAAALGWLVFMTYKSTRRPKVEPRLKVMDRAPDIQFETIKGPISLSDFWDESWVAVVWPRHAGCPFFLEQLEILAREAERFENVGASLLVVSASFPKMTEQTRKDLGSSLTWLPDPRRRSHQRYELRYSTYGAMVTSKRVNQRYREVNRKGYKAHAKRSFSGASDWLQLPGACVIDPKGQLRFIHRADEVCELAPIDDMVAAIVQGRQSELDPEPSAGAR